MSTPEYFRSLAAESIADAASSPLVNVRDRAERSASVWMEMADRLEQTEAFKLRNGRR